MGKVLVVDDSMLIRQKVSDFLLSKGHTVFDAEDGASGIDIFKKDPTFDLIITDLNMPEMNGIEMCSALQALEVPLPPIFMLTTETNPELKTRGKAAGVNGWIVKPFSEQKLSILLESVFKKHV